MSCKNKYALTVICISLLKSRFWQDIYIFTKIGVLKNFFEDSHFRNTCISIIMYKMGCSYPKAC